MDNLDIKKLERLFIETDANLVAKNQIIENLMSENLHLRQVIEMLITHESPKI